MSKRYAYTMVAKYMDSDEIVVNSYSSKKKLKDMFTKAIEQHNMNHVFDSYAYTDDKNMKFYSLEIFITVIK